MESLIARHLPSLRAFVRLRVNSFLRARESESDVVQSVCCEILQHMQGFEYQGEARFRNWLYGACSTEQPSRCRIVGSGRQMRRQWRCQGAA